MTAIFYKQELKSWWLSFKIVFLNAQRQIWDILHGVNSLGV